MRRGSWIEEQIALLESLLARREAWIRNGGLEARSSAVILRRGEDVSAEAERIRRNAQRSKNAAEQVGGNTRRYHRIA